MAREFSKVGVIGLGTMGAGIVEVFARNGLDVDRRRGRRGRRSSTAAASCSTRPTGPWPAAS